jgi:ectoine hydroxylase-related dioxygenase (phytanoyl-CoA dioxygenase family)
VLSAEEVRQFERDGYLAVRGMFDAAQVAEIDRWTDELENAPEVPGRHWVYREQSVLDPDTKVLQRIENFYPFHEGFAALMTKGPLVACVEQLFGEKALLFKDKINFKMPGGQGFKPHQDQQAGWSAYASLFITALVAIDPTTLENGCLEIAAGRHRRQLIGEEWRPLNETEMSAFKMVPVPTAPGDVLLFDSYVPHASAPNCTSAKRRVLYVTYNRAAEGDQRARYYADKHKSFPPDIEREAGKTYVFRV